MNPVGSVFVYSDLSMITLMFVVGTVVEREGLVSRNELVPECAAVATNSVRGRVVGAIAQCYYEAYVRQRVFTPLGMKRTQFLPPTSLYVLCSCS